MYKCVKLTHCTLHSMPYVNYIPVKTEKEGEGREKRGKGEREERKGPVHSSKMGRGSVACGGPV